LKLKKGSLSPVIGINIGEALPFDRSVSGILSDEEICTIGCVRPKF
jgi:hypothetical protein